MKNLLLISTFILPVAVFGQASVKKASNYFNNYSYSKVIEKLEGKEQISTDARRKLADSYRMSLDFKNAELEYSKVVASAEKTPEDVYAYAQVLKMNGKYAEAQQQMDAYATLKATDSRANLYKQNKDYAIDLLKDKGQFDVKNLAVNSTEQDFGVAYYKDQIVYTSSKQPISGAYRRWNGNNLPFLDLYIGKEDATA